MKQVWPAPERNKGPILNVLKRYLPERGTLLEIASGSGQHAAHFAAALPKWTFQPSDPDPQNLASVRAFREELRLPNLVEPLQLDVRDRPWPVDEVDAIFNANMIHITPWSCAQALFLGAGKHLRLDGMLVIYGPFRISGGHTAESNARFDADLRARDPSWGVRDLEAVTELARAQSLTLCERIEMPANNQTLIWTKVKAHEGTPISV